MGRPPQVNRIVAQPPVQQQQQAAPAAKPTSPSNDLLQLDTAFASSIHQPTSTSGFSPSAGFPPSQTFPPMHQTAPVGFAPSPWGPPASAPNAGE